MVPWRLYSGCHDEKTNGRSFLPGAFNFNCHMLSKDTVNVNLRVSRGILLATINDLGGILCAWFVLDMISREMLPHMLDGERRDWSL